MGYRSYLLQGPGRVLKLTAFYWLAITMSTAAFALIATVASASGAHTLLALAAAMLGSTSILATSYYAKWRSVLRKSRTSRLWVDRAQPGRSHGEKAVSLKQPGLPKQSPKVLVIAEGSNADRLIQDELVRQGYEILPARSGDELMAALRSRSPDLVVIDLAMPNLDGLAVIKKVREASIAPVLVVLAPGGEGLEQLAQSLTLVDDYMVKPVPSQEFLMRVRAALRMSGSKYDAEALPAMYRHRNLELQFAQGVATLEGKEVTLTATEWRLLQVLASSPGRAISIDELTSLVLGSEYSRDYEFLRLTLGRLQAKIEVHPHSPEHLVHTEHGYMMLPGRGEAE